MKHDCPDKSSLFISNLKLSVLLFLSVQIGLLFFSSALCWAKTKKYQVNPELIKKFYEPKVAGNKTGLYIIRGDNPLLRARSVWVAINDSVVASLPNDSNVYLELDEGFNTLNFVFQTVGYGYLAIDNKPGEVIYVKFDFANTYLSEFLDKDLGKSMVMETVMVKPLTEKRKNDGYDNLIMNPGILDYPVMVESSDVLTPDENYAVVRFYRKDAGTCKICPFLIFDVWSKDGYIGSSKDETYFSVRLKPGRHSFYTFYGMYRVLKAELKANMEYAVEIHASRNYNYPAVKLVPVNLKLTSEKRKVNTWKKKLKPISINNEIFNNHTVAERIEMGFSFLNDGVAAVSNDIAKDYLPEKYGR